MSIYSAVILVYLWILSGAVPLTVFVSTLGYEIHSLCVNSYCAYILCGIVRSFKYIFGYLVELFH